MSANDENEYINETEENNEKESINNINNSLGKGREDFIQKFTTEKNLKGKDEKDKKGRWIHLYNQSKIQKDKIENIRKEKEKQKEEEIYSECTFMPKLNKFMKFNKNKSQSKELKTEGSASNYLNDSYNQTIATRQKTWAKKRDDWVNGQQKEKKLKELEQCHFIPETVRY